MSNVVITTCAAVAGTGQSLDEIYTAIKLQQSGIRPLETWDVEGWDYQLACEVKDYNPRKMLKDRKLIKLLSRQDVVGLCAYEQAVEQSGLMELAQGNAEFNDRTGLFVASPGNKFFQQYDYMPLLARAADDWGQFGEKIFEEVHPMWLLRTLPNNVLAYAGINYGFKGPNHNITNHVCGGIQAILEAKYHIEQGLIDRAFVVAYETMEPQGIMHYANLGVLSQQQVKPFASDRDGTILGEAAAVILLESAKAAEQRGAAVLGEVMTGTINSEAQGVFGIDRSGEGLSRNIETTLKQAGITPAQLGFITAHGNGTVVSDHADALALTSTAPDVPVTAFKWSIGHTVTAAGVLETILSLLALNDEVIPGIANCDRIAPECEPLNISQDNRSLQEKMALVSCRGFGSFNASLLIKAS